VSDLLEQPPAFGARHKALLLQLLQPLQEHLAELTAEQLIQVSGFSIRLVLQHLQIVVMARSQLLLLTH
jgi:hypothetical protein